MNYTTSIDQHTTASEVSRMLVAHGARRIVNEYDDAALVGLSFELATPHGVRIFRLPVDVEAMHRLLVEQDRAGKLGSLRKDLRTSREQAARVAWRVVKDWLAAQLALLETQMASVDELMLPYLVVDGSGTTLYQAYAGDERLALGPGTED